MEKLNAYDEIPYTSSVFKTAQPENSFIAGLIYGLNPANVESARVLEIGCAGGGNIIPFALKHKSAKVVGIDLSKNQIKQAKSLAKKLAIQNISFYQKDILEIDDGFGEFDYIIAHGIYSWVPDSVKDGIFKIFSKCLSKDGIAYLSYNTYPGWKFKEILRDIMLFRTLDREISSDDKFKLGLDTLKFLKNNPKDHLIKSTIDEYYDNLVNKPSSYIMHEYFEDVNNPDYFKDVAKIAREYGLEFLCEADIVSSVFAPVSGELKEALQKECGKDRVKFEQFIGFITNKTFRRTLFVKSEFAKEINPEINIKYETLDELFVDGKFSYDSTQKAYKNLTNNEYMPRNMGELLDKLSEIYPSNLKVGKFIDEYKNYHSKEEVDEMYKNLCFLLCAKKLNFELFEMKFNPSIKDKPKIDSAYLKLLDYIKQNGKLVSFFTPKYENASIDENVDFEFLPYFDGTRSFDELVNELIKIEKDGKFRFVIEDRTVTSKEKIASLAKNYVKAKIQFLYENAFLV